MIIKHNVQRRYKYGGSGIFEILGKIASKVASKTPENLVNKITKEVIKHGEKALVDQTGNLTKAAIKRIAGSKPSKVKQKFSAIINSLESQPFYNLNSLISGAGLKPITRGGGILID